MIKLNTLYRTKEGGVVLHREGGKLVILSRYKPCKLDIRKVRKLGLLVYLQHVGAAQGKSARNKQAVYRKYADLQRIILKIQAGEFSAVALPTQA